MVPTTTHECVRLTRPTPHLDTKRYRKCPVVVHACPRPRHGEAYEAQADHRGRALPRPRQDPCISLGS